MKMKRWKGLRNQGRDDQEETDYSVLVGGLYNRNSNNPIAIFFTINLPSGCTKDVRA